MVISIHCVSNRQAQKLVSSDEEWTQMIECLKSDLPAAFRITSGLPETSFLLKIVQGTNLVFDIFPGVPFLTSPERERPAHCLCIRIEIEQNLLLTLTDDR